MADSLGNVSISGAPLIPGVAAAAAQPAIELAQQPPPALLLAATLAAVVVGRGGNGALLLRTDYGTLALKTALSLLPGSRVDLKLLPGPPPSVMLLHIEAPTGQAETLPAAPPLPAGAAPPPPAGKAAAAALAADAPPTQLALGSEVEATLIAPPPAGPGPDPVGTRLVLRVVLPVPGAPPPPSSGGGAAPASFTGTIASPAADPAQKTVVETPLGTLSLDKRLALPPGTVLDFTRLATLPPAAPDQLASATVVAARLVSPAPGSTVPALPAGSRLELRVQPLPLPGAPAPAAPDLALDLIGTVVTTTAGETLVETRIGMLALERRLAVPAGTRLSLQRLAAAPPDQPADLPLAQRTTWPALEETLAALDRVMPELALRLRSDLSPASGQQLAGTLLFLMSALNSGTWPGAKTAAALDAAGRRDLSLKLDGDVAELRQLAAPQSGDWRVYVLPLLDGSMVRPVRFYLRRRSADAASGDQGTRFVVEVEMSRLGALQLDGLVRPQRLDLVLRSHRPVAPELRQEIAELFRNVTTASGLAGDISFATASRFAVAPLQAMRARIGVTA